MKNIKNLKVALGIFTLATSLTLCGCNNEHEIANLQENIEMLQETNENLEKENKELQEEIAKLKEEKTEIKKENKNLENKIKAIDKTIETSDTHNTEVATTMQTPEQLEKEESLDITDNTQTISENNEKGIIQNPEQLEKELNELIGGSVFKIREDTIIISGYQLSYNQEREIVFTEQIYKKLNELPKNINFYTYNMENLNFDYSKLQIFTSIIHIDNTKNDENLIKWISNLDLSETLLTINYDEELLESLVNNNKSIHHIFINKVEKDDLIGKLNAQYITYSTQKNSIVLDANENIDLITIKLENDNESNTDLSNISITYPENIIPLTVEIYSNNEFIITENTNFSLSNNINLKINNINCENVTPLYNLANITSLTYQTEDKEFIYNKNNDLGNFEKIIDEANLIEKPKVYEK